MGHLEVETGKTLSPRLSLLLPTCPAHPGFCASMWKVVVSERPTVLAGVGFRGFPVVFYMACMGWANSPSEEMLSLLWEA